MAFSKFDPHRDAGSGPGDPSALRRALILRWASLVSTLFTALGFGLMAYWLITRN